MARMAFHARLVILFVSAVCSLCLSAGTSWGESPPPPHGSTSPRGCPDLIHLIKELTPAVVSISIERHMLQKNSVQSSSSLRSRPESRHGRLRSRDGLQLDSLGSGFLSDSEGHIVTNAHVVEGATKILVTLSSGKVCTAELVAIHPKVDLALIKIEPPYPLKKVPVGDSSRVQVGEWVLAIGNPFGLGKTVTFGIVSGKGRFIGLGPDDDFIQTDASINPGNSGGPLFNMNGEVIGVNTAIIASGKGIGFSIPSNYIRQLVRSPRGMKQPVRGWLGIYVDDMTEEQARALGLTTPRGTFVDEVLAGTPASSAGMKAGDLILNAEGQEIRNGRHLSRIVSGTRPGAPIRMIILRGNKRHALEVIVGKSPE